MSPVASGPDPEAAPASPGFASDSRPAAGCGTVAPAGADADWADDPLAASDELELPPARVTRNPNPARTRQHTSAQLAAWAEGIRRRRRRPSGRELPGPDARAALPAGLEPRCGVRSAEVAARLHVQAVPFLVVFDADDRVRYAGGYTSARERPDLQDDRLIAEVQAGGSPAALPVFGCATTSELQQKLDPFGLKY